MRTLYADSSALVRAYFEDEDEHRLLRDLLLESGEQVITSELARIEIASALQSAARAGRIPDARAVEQSIEVDFDVGGALILLDLDARKTLPTAQRLIREHRLRTLDAIHLAVALDAPTFLGSDNVVLVTRDADQAAAARALGLAVH